jgi:hypothetical protein
MDLQSQAAAVRVHVVQSPAILRAGIQDGEQIRRDLLVRVEQL